MSGGSEWRIVISGPRLALYAWTCMRFTTRGLLRFRRRGLSLSRISSCAAFKAVIRRGGGKTRLVRDLAADDAE